MIWALDSVDNIVWKETRYLFKKTDGVISTLSQSSPDFSLSVV